MTFKTQAQVDALAVSAADGPSGPAVLTTVSGDEFDILIIRSGQIDRMMMDPGQADSSMFRVFKKNSEDDITISPNDKITLEDESVWIVQTGVTVHAITGTWSVPVTSDGRVAA